MSDFIVRKDNKDTWRVFLPHQCDEWAISYYDSSHDKAISDLEAFLEDGHQALIALKNRQEFGEW